MGIEEKPLPPSPSLSLGANTDTQRSQGRIGTALQEIRLRLASIASRLEPHLDPHALPLVTQARRLIQDQSCRIAVVGQIKAGKSSFINAFVQRGELLPTDINPWTAVVTSLHFRDDGAPPRYAAQFHMFTREEWQRLAEGGGRLRELTERLVPGFEPGLLRAQIEVMRTRVEQRLGSGIDQLLGQTHSYETATPELIDSYVSAGTYLDAEVQASRRNYSDITRAADLYLSGGPFACPVTLVDTPGTNDPFLVRDEITRRSLENADMFLFVISALQPLSADDIALLRILNGLHKERIVVFINRIDQLRNPLAEAASIRASVKNRLDREFPALDIPVLAGSAWWGGLSLVASGRDVYRLLPQSSLAYLAECGLGTTADATALPGTPEHRARLARALHLASGLPAVGAAVNGMINTGSAAAMLRQLATCFHELARTTEVSARMGLQSARELAQSHQSEARTNAERIRQERAALGHLDAPIGQIQHSFALIERQLHEILNNDISALRRDLSGIVDSFANEECAAMMVAIRRRDHDGQWQANLAPLRGALESHYTNAYRATESRVIEIERVLYPQLKTIVDAIVPGSGLDVHADYAQPTSPYPSVAPLSEMAVLDLGVPWWRMWFAARPDPTERANHLKQLILDDFLPMTDELARQAHAALGARVTRTLQQAHAVSTGMLTTIQKRKAQVVADYEVLLARQASGSTDRMSPEIEAHLTQAAARHAAATTLVDDLAKLVQLCQSAFVAVERRV
jgi:signal recognition particle receptor subunit beta